MSHPVGTWNPRDTAPACVSLPDLFRTCRGPLVSPRQCPCGGRQLTSPRPAPAQPRQPIGHLAVTLRLTPPRPSREPLRREQMRPDTGFWGKARLMELREARPASPASLPLKHMSSGDRGVQASGWLWTGKRNWWPGRPREAAPTHETKPSRQWQPSRAGRGARVPRTSRCIRRREGQARGAAS